MSDGFGEFFRRATGEAPFPYQTAFATSDEFPDLVAAPTGAGKTATAILGWLWRRRFAEAAVRARTPRRLVFCLPMRTLVEQTLNVAATWLGNVRLADIGLHALLGGAVDQAWDEFPDRDAIIIGTQDQLISRALNRGYAMSRYRWPVHFALLNDDCLWVLDEVQLMGAGLSTSAQLQAFRDRFGTTRVCRSVWMSATLDRGKLDTVDFRERALSTLQLSQADLQNDGLRLRHHASKQLAMANAPFDDPGQLTAEILDRHQPGTLTLAVLNRVARAQALYRALLATRSNFDLALLHSRFRPIERKEIQQRVLAQGWSGILVATQAIEAGVDISARVLFTEVAPWSSMVQRFGRCNRRGEWTCEAKIRWIDIPDGDAAPYDAADLAVSRQHLARLDDAGPASLAAIPQAAATPALPVIRRRDLLELFDNQPDVAGQDIDISPFIRSSVDRDLQIAWRDLDDRAPSPDAPEPHRDELCSVPIDQLRKLLANQNAYRWNGLSGTWEPLLRPPVPGMVLLAPRSVGGYDASLGWTGDKRDIPSPVDRTTQPADADDREMLTFGCDHYVDLATHASDVADELRQLEHVLGGSDPWRAIERAARWHDLGKVHPIFQQMLVATLPPNAPERAGGPWAKSDGVHGARCSRPHFRHELASALALLQQGGSDLEAYLVAAHHGKVRMSIRSRPGEREPDDGRRFALGVWEGDMLPAADLGDGVRSSESSLSLVLMDLGDGDDGPSWMQRVLGLLEVHGPFKLAYWEMLVRVADWRGTMRRRAAGSKR